MVEFAGNSIRAAGRTKGQEEPHYFSVHSDEIKQRLDLFLVGKLPDLSRSFIGKLIISGHVLVDGKSVKAGYKLRVNDKITLFLTPQEQPDIKAEPIDFPILFEDEHILVLVKPPGLVVHPAAGHHEGTLVHGLLHHCNNLPQVDATRPGIVHRLDKDTSGIMVVAKTEQALRRLTADFKDRRIEKTYHALLMRCPHEHEGRIVEPIGRHPVHRKKMAIRQVHGKYAATNWQVKEIFNNGWCLAEISIETGRTHQIRVHMAALNAPVVGDAVYGGKSKDLLNFLPDRQMLHGSTLRFQHPFFLREECFTAPLWPDMLAILEKLRMG